jgi:hypothetical protein
MNHSTKVLIKDSGFKLKFLADKIGLHPSQLSMAIKGDRALPFGKEEELKKFLAKVPQ